MALTIISSENAKLEVSGDGSTFSALPFIGDISASGGEAPESDIVTFSGVGKLTGHPRVPSISVSIPSFVPNLSVWKTILDALSDRGSLSWRITTLEEELAARADAADTAAITETGAVTFAGDAPDFGAGTEFAIGMVIEVAGAKYTIDQISSEGAVTVEPAPEMAVAAQDDYKILNPSLRLGPFIAAVRSAGNFELPAEGALTTTLELAPRSQLPQWTVV